MVTEMAEITTSMKMARAHHAAFSAEAESRGLTLSAWARTAMAEKLERDMAARGSSPKEISAWLQGGALAAAEATAAGTGASG